MVHLSTTLHCKSGKTIHLEDDGLDVNVVPVPEPNIEITGTQNIARDYEDFKLGVRIFADVHIVMTTGSSTGGEFLLMVVHNYEGEKVKVSVTWGSLLVKRVTMWGGGIKNCPKLRDVISGRLLKKKVFLQL